MDFKFAHNSITVLDLERSIAFYREALGLREVSRRKSRGRTGYAGEPERRTEVM